MTNLKINNRFIRFSSANMLIRKNEFQYKSLWQEALLNFTGDAGDWNIVSETKFKFLILNIEKNHAI